MNQTDKRDKSDYLLVLRLVFTFSWNSQVFYSVIVEKLH